LEGFRRISSEHKWLDVHGRKKWAYYYDPESVQRQRVFFDYFLHGRGPGPVDWPRVRMEARESYYRGRRRTASQWPPAETEYRPLYLHAPAAAGGRGTLAAEPGDVAEQTSYDSLGSGLAPRRAEFEITFPAPAELIGHMVATLYLSAPQSDDLDVFVALFKLDPGGAPVGFPYYAQFEDGPMAVGWQRASHREADPERSTPYLPVLAHRRELPVPRGDIVRLDIEVLPSGTRFEAGEKLLLVVQGSDVNRYPKPAVYARHEDTVNNGPHILHTGGRYGSRLVIPVLPGSG
jgi:putative CocE/NonD family hydrolase